MKLIKNIKIGKANFLKLFIIVVFIFYISNINSLENSESLDGNFIEIKILDKVSSKNNVLKIKIGEEQKFKNLLIKSLKCKNSEFLHLRLFINKPLNLSSLPISNFKRSVFELTLSKTLISTNVPSLAIKGSDWLIKKK